MAQRLDKYSKAWEITSTAMRIVQQRKERRAAAELINKENIDNQTGTWAKVRVKGQKGTEGLSDFEFERGETSLITEKLNNGLPQHDYLSERILKGLSLTGIADAQGVKNHKEDKSAKRLNQAAANRTKAKEEHKEKLKMVERQCDMILLCRPSMVTLDLSNLRLDEECIFILSKAIVLNTVIRTINLQSNGVTDNAFKHLAHCLALSGQLKNLNVGSNLLTDKCIKDMTKVMARNHEMIELNLTGKKHKIDHFRLPDRPSKLQPRITPIGIARLTQGICEHPNLLTLCLGHQDLGDRGATLMADSLLHNDTLTSINLSFNGIGSDGARAFGNLLGLNVSLRHLDLSNNTLRDEGIMKLAVGIQKNSALKILDVAKTKHTAHACDILTRAIDRRTYGSTLSVVNHGNAFPQTSEMAAALKIVEAKKEAEHRVSSRRKEVCVVDQDHSLMEMRDLHREKYALNKNAWASIAEALR